MRKWMRERIKRRKKPEETAGTDSTKPVPLQPAYYDAQPSASSPTEESHDADDAAEETPQLAAKADAQVTDAQPESATSPVDPQRRRRRRGRGGRGRSRTGRSPGETKPEDAKPTTPVPDQIEPAAPVAAAAPARPSKGVVVLAIGLPGSGKSSWFKRHGIQPLSSDLLRALLFDDAQEQRFQDLVFSNLRSMLKARLIARRPLNYLDATNLTPHERHNWIKLAKDYGYEVQAVFFDVPLDVCLDRNRRRQRTVDEGAMQRMSSKLRPPMFDEGFSKITVVRVKKKDGDVPASEAS